MRHTVLLMAGTLLIFAIATLPVAAYFGEDHLRAFWAGGLVSLLAVAAGSALTRLSLRWFEHGPTTSALVGPVVRLLLTLTALVLVPRHFELEMQAFGGWLVLSYLAILFVESGFLAHQQTN